MNRYGITEMHHNYLDSLIADFPMNDYVKNGKERKKQRRKKLVNKIAFQVVGGIIILAGTFLVVSAEWWVQFI